MSQRTETSRPPRLQTAMLIDGQWVAARSGATIAVLNPADGTPLASVPAGSAADIDAAVSAARRAFADGRWTGLAPRDRARILMRVADLIDVHAEELAHIETLDNGMPFSQALQGHVPAAAACFRYYASWCDKIDGKTANLSGNGVDYHAYTLLEPIGVVGIITPWNAPIVTAAKLAPALAAGCSCVLKPAEDTPLTALRLGELLIEAGIPAGVVNIVTGLGSEAGAALAGHEGVDKISFTGSTVTGRSVIAAATRNLKKVTLELGGKSPVVVMNDADLERAIPAAANAVFANAGQVCSAGTRLYIQRESFERVVAGIAELAARIRLGNGMDPRTQMGPLVSQRQLDRVIHFIDSGRGEGAELVTGGERHGEQGYFIKPTVFVNTRPQMRIVREEIFGPVLVAAPIDDVSQILPVANDSSYGLAAAIFTRDLSTAHRFAKQVQAGTVWINTYHLVDVAMPWGGFKQSGWGRENGYDGLLAYLQTKSVVAAL